MSAKHKALLAQKKKLLQEMKYYEKRIEEFRANTKKVCFDEDDDSSDSDTELTSFDNGPSIKELRQQQNMLKLCLQATQELTRLEVKQCEVNLMVDDPPLNGESPVEEKGNWWEVVAECCVYHVPFIITFYVFKASRSFAPLEYRCLKVAALKRVHELELSACILPELVRPSDAVELIRSYALAHRSRRTTFACLVDKFTKSLLVEVAPDGGYRMKYANLLNVYWTLENKWSPIAPFHHRLKFDLDYMDEGYVRTIAQAHRELLEPDVDTEERTHLLARIISTCLEAQGPTQELHDSMSSDPETAHNLRKRRTTLDREPEGPSVKRANKDSEVMAPPKGLPKKLKKGKETIVSNKKTTKRPIENNEDLENTKKAKTVESSEEHEEVNESNNEEMIFDTNKIVSTSKHNGLSEKSSDISKNKCVKKKSVKNHVNETENTSKTTNETQRTEVQNTEKSTSVNKVKKSSQNTLKPYTKETKPGDKTAKPKENTEKPKYKASKSDEKMVKSTKTVVKPAKEVGSTKTNKDQTNATEKNTEKPQNGAKVVKDSGKVIKKAGPKNFGNEPKNKENVQKNDNTKKIVLSNANIAAEINIEHNQNAKFASDKNTTFRNNVADNNVHINKNKIGSTLQKKPVVSDNILNKKTGNNLQKVKKNASAANTNAKVTEKVKASQAIPGKTSDASAHNNVNVTSAEKIPKTNSSKTKMQNVHPEKTKQIVTKVVNVTNKAKATTIPGKKISVTGNANKAMSAGNSGKANAQNKLKVSKIPLKKLSSENSLKITPLRVSPRQPVMKSKVLSRFGSDTKLKPK